MPRRGCGFNKIGLNLDAREIAERIMREIWQKAGSMSSYGDFRQPSKLQLPRQNAVETCCARSGN
jgi:hypothetical protein